MAAATHIPISELSPETKSLVDRVLVGEEIVVDADGAAVHLSRSRSYARTPSEILADPNIKWSNARPDENFAKDLEDIIAERKLPWRDPWAE